MLPQADLVLNFLFDWKPLFILWFVVVAVVVDGGGGVVVVVAAAAVAVDHLSACFFVLQFF